MTRGTHTVTRTVNQWNNVSFKIFSRMVVNSYITDKEDIPTESKPMSRLDFTITMSMRRAKNGYTRRVQLKNQANEM